MNITPKVIVAGALILLIATFSSHSAQAQPISLPATIAYVVNTLSDSVSVIDTSTNMLIDTIPVGDGPQRVVFSPDGTWAYVTNQLDDTVSVIDTFTSIEIDVDGDSSNGMTRIAVGDGPFGIDVSPDGTRVYVGNEFSGDMSVIDTSTNSVIATIDLQISGPSQRTPAVTPDGTEVWIGVGADTNTIKRFAVSDNALLPTIGSIIGGAVRLEFLPDGTSAFAQNQCGACGNLQRISTDNLVVSKLN